jgi:hypothetical protein
MPDLSPYVEVSKSALGTKLFDVGTTAINEGGGSTIFSLTKEEVKA